MRILSISAQKPDSTGSGVYLTELVREFAAMGHTQAVIAGVYASDSPILPRGTEFFPVCFNTKQLPFPIAGMSDEMPYESTVYSTMTPQMKDSFLAAFEYALDKAVNSFCPDVILCHHLYLLTAFVRKKYPHKQVWGICHGTDLRQMEKNPLWRQEIKEQIPLLNKIFCLHEEQKQAIIKCYGADKKIITVVGNGYNSHIFCKKCGCDTACGQNKIRLIFAGKISEKKGVFSLLNCLPLLGWDKDRFSLRLAGGWGSEEQKQQVETIIAQSGYDISLLGNLTQQELAEEFRKSDIFILPSFYDGLPLVLAESMACGSKVICTDLPGIKTRFDKDAPGHGICFVQPPEMLNADEPIKESLPAFEQRLAKAIVNTAACPCGKADLSALSWRAVCEKMLGL